MPRDLQTALSAGELDPSLHSHADLAKYRSGLAICENWFVLAQGGIATRGGWEFVNEIIDSSSAARTIDFQFNTEQAYALIFTDQKMRVVRNGGMVLEPVVVIGGASQASPVTITAPAHGYSDGDDVFITGIVGMTELNDRFFKITNTTAGTFDLSGIDGTGYTAYSSGGTVSLVYTLDTPYLEADLFRLKYTQSADVMTISHPDYDTRNLSRTDHDAWALSTISYASSMSPPSAGLAAAAVGTASGSPNKTYRYVITSVSAGGDESAPSAVVSTTLNALNETYGVRLSWNTVADAEFYNVYKEFSLNSNIFGWVGEADEEGTPSFDDYNFGPDMSYTPPVANDPFSGADDKPACVEYYQQRQWFGGTTNNPQTLNATRTADYDNMDTSRPTRADDAITATIAAKQVNEIRHIVSLDDLIVLTSGGVWKIEADQDGILTPANINPRRQQGSRGSNHVIPVVIGETALYVQEKGARIRDLQYTFEDDRYTGNDLSILARHMFKGKEIVDWAYAEEPYSIVWAVRDDGVMLSLTYLKEHNVYAWSRHVTDGEFESVCAISEGDQDVVYAIVKRTINGSDVRYIERMHEREFDDLEDAFCVDAGLTYDGASTTTISNLHHLEGETVAVLADGNVVPDLVVTDGEITLPNAAEKVHVGLGYNCDFQTLEVSFQGEVTQSRKKQVARVALRVLDSRGLSAGKDASSLYEIKERTPAMAYGDIPPLTKQEFMQIKPGWNDYGQVYVRQSYPLPATVLAVIPEVVVSA